MISCHSINVFALKLYKRVSKQQKETNFRKPALEAITGGKGNSKQTPCNWKTFLDRTNECWLIIALATQLVDVENCYW